ncbi:hypothetical protein PSPO01_15623 [Paraphaeosphaeria sporulosa]
MPRSEKGSAATSEGKDLSELDQPNGLLLTNDTNGYLENDGAVADASGGCSAAMLPQGVETHGFHEAYPLQPANAHRAASGEFFFCFQWCHMLLTITKWRRENSHMRTLTSGVP